MAYVRQRGNQLAIVHGARHSATGKVEQRILFTLFSKPEALEAIGKGPEGNDERFRSLLEYQYPEIPFNWKAMNRAIAANLDVLPDTYEYRDARVRSHFRQDLCAFARQIILSDPRDLASAGEVIREHRHELEYMTDLIRFWLECCDQEPPGRPADNEYCWRFALRGSDVPQDAEEHAADLFEEGKYDAAEAIFKLLHDSFGEYAEGHNYLGLIALERRNPDLAIAHFRKTVELGRRHFPKRVSKKTFRENYRVRPYLRGLTNLAATLNQVGRYPEALAILDHLDQECGDAFTADSYRAAIALNTGAWEEAANRASRYCEIDPSQSLPTCLAFFQMGRRREAAAHLLHGALNHPLATRMLHGLRATEPRSREEQEDWNLGVYTIRNLGAYLKQRRPATRAFFRRLLKHPHLLSLQAQIAAAKRVRRNERQAGPTGTYEVMTRMGTLDFARGEVGVLLESSAADPAQDRRRGRVATALS
ncbi:MAG: hypothetical protein HZA54_13160 [Planctomycetes bacterium]|nr:hypothetical protein [Planctomycetota bacterium]